MLNTGIITRYASICSIPPIYPDIIGTRKPVIDGAMEYIKVETVKTSARSFEFGLITCASVLYAVL